MAGEDRVVMRMKELKRLNIIHQGLEGRLSQVEAAGKVELSDRQMRRMVKRVREEGDGGLIHRSRGRVSNRAIAQKSKRGVLRLYRARYGDFGPTLASEKLAQCEGICLSKETLRLWLLAEGITQFQRRRRPHRRWRERKRHAGEMVQMDGSHHNWFEGRGPVCVLMGYIDDAPGRVFARFYEYEGTIPAMDSIKRYLWRYGIPMRVYLDKHTTYRSPAKATITEQLEGQEPKSQFERSLGELGVEVIHADSPQAKGRIERLFGTFQDRLIKEMRLVGVASVEEANRFLSRYLAIHNRRFSVKAMEAADLHRPVPEGCDLEGILCIKTERALRNDFTVAHNRRLYQVEDNVRASRVMVEERLNGSMAHLSGAKASLSRDCEPTGEGEPDTFSAGSEEGRQTGNGSSLEISNPTQQRKKQGNYLNLKTGHF
jgi:hypothetical protein